MDPLGFALENFDTVGQLRERDPDTGGPVDSAGVLPDGTPIAGPDDLRKALLARSDQFVQALTGQLLSYALGRHLDHRDMPVVRRIARQAAPEDFRFASIVSQIVATDAFRRREAAPPPATTVAAMAASDAPAALSGGN